MKTKLVATTSSPIGVSTSASEPDARTLALYKKWEKPAELTVEQEKQFKVFKRLAKKHLDAGGSQIAIAPDEDGEPTIFRAFFRHMSNQGITLNAMQAFNLATESAFSPQEPSMMLMRVEGTGGRLFIDVLV